MLTRKEASELPSRQEVREGLMGTKGFLTAVDSMGEQGGVKVPAQHVEAIDVAIQKLDSVKKK
jgi:hypothetical protein